MKRREAKSKGEMERYTYLNTEFQRIARRDKKAFLSNQCKEIEENNRIGKTRDLFKSHVLHYFVFILCPDTVYSLDYRLNKYVLNKQTD